MIAVYGDHGLGQRSNETFQEMCAGFGPNEITFVNLLTALAHSGNEL